VLWSNPECRSWLVSYLVSCQEWVQDLNSNDQGGSAADHFDDVACPFCGILCDDLTISRGPAGLKVMKNGCDKAIAGFERSVASTGPQIAGKSATLAEAIAAAAKLVKGAKLPIFGGLGTDVEGMRAVMSIADNAGGVVDHALSEGQYRNFKVLQSGGWVMTTLTEARNRADLFVIVGSDLHKLHPRFFERIVCNERSMFSDTPAKRTVVFLGEGLDQSAAVGARIGEVVSLPCKGDRIGEIMVAMRAMSKGVAISGDTIGGLPRAAVENLVERCKAATYGVMVWAPPSLAFPNADLTVQAVAEYVKDINAHSRFAGLSLGGNEGAVTAGAVCAWQSGYPLRVSFASGKPHYDVERYAMTRLLANRESDLLVWVASYTPDLSPPETDVPMIVLGTPGLKLAKQPAVFIPVGTPGADHSGLIVRCDNVVSLPLRNLGRSTLPRTADVLAQIEAAL
jgi:formylmethanofuran dehydrogenase subunit B